MSTVQTEQVMVVKTELFRSCGYFQGFSRETEKYLDTLLDSANTQYLPRGKMEEDPEFKQLIPYCLFRYTDAEGKAHVFQYTRGKGGGESRLRAKKSVGIGDQNDVGKVHLGIVHLFDVDQPTVSARETEISDAGFLPLAEILVDLESASKAFLRSKSLLAVEHHTVLAV